MKYYVVKKGREIGVFKTWEECRQQVEGFSNAQYKSFTTLEAANKYLEIRQKKPLNQDTFCRIYVDGSYDLLTKRYSYGMVVLYLNQEKHFYEAFDDEDASMRNVAGEVKGALKAMEYCVENNINQLALYYDYYGIEKWALKEWKANKKATKAYQVYYDEIKEDLEVVFYKVKSHTNDKYNDLADFLAKKALQDKK